MSKLTTLRLKDASKTLVTFRYSRHFNADATVLYHEGKALINVHEFCEGMAKNLHWNNPFYEVKSRFATYMTLALRKIGANPSYEGMRVKYLNEIYCTAPLIGEALHKVLKHIHSKDEVIICYMSKWMCSDELADQLAKAEGYRAAIVVSDPRLKRRVYGPGDWGYSRGCCFRIPPKQAPWDVDYTARFRAMQGPDADASQPL